MPLTKTTLLFQGQDVGWTESYYFVSEDVGIAFPNNLDACLDYVINGMREKRRLLLGKQFSIVAVRCGFPATNVKAKIRYILSPGNSAHDGAAPELSVVAQFGDELNTHIKYTSLRGIWDEIEIEGGQFVGPASPAWIGNWNSWVVAMIAGKYKWKGSVSSVKQPIINVIQLTDERIQFDLDAPLFPAPLVGSYTKVRVSGLNVTSRLNTELVGRVVNTSRFVTQFPYAMFPYIGGGFMRWNDTGYFQTTTITPQRIGSRDVGRPFKRFRGRRRNIPRG